MLHRHTHVHYCIYIRTHTHTHLTQIHMHFAPIPCCALQPRLTSERWRGAPAPGQLGWKKKKGENHKNVRRSRSVARKIKRTAATRKASACQRAPLAPSVCSTRSSLSCSLFPPSSTLPVMDSVSSASRLPQLPRPHQNHRQRWEALEGGRERERENLSAPP